MPTAKMLPSGTWRVRVYAGKKNGVTVTKSFTADTKKKAELKAMQYVNGSKEEQIEIETTFLTAMSSFITLREPVLSPSTIRGYKSIERVLKTKHKAFCALPIADIDDKALQQVIDKFAADGKSPKYIRNVSAFIQSVIKQEAPEKIYRLKLPQKVKYDIYIPTDEEIKLLIKETENNPDLRIPIMLGAFCTMRRSEICALSLSNISGTTIHIKQGLVLGSDKAYHIKTTKTVSSDRYIQAPDFVIDEIKKHGRITNYNPNALTDAFRYALEKNSIPHFRFHDLRHYSISVKHALGIPDAYIMQDSGHSSDYTLKNVYRHAMTDRRKEMIQKANDHFSGMI